ncbi:hypothetical protein [Streptomyces sp. NPDC002054]|uniref:hypothetical protein n=1 Tax=Streptomyces sp. NPDC002054 TaxID=3154663 RepID=UPI00332BBF8A
MPEQWEELLPAAVREQVDASLTRGRTIEAIKIAWDELRERGLGMREAQQFIAARYEALVPREDPDDPLDLASLADRTAGLPGRIVAIEAVWDGDTVHDWFVLLIAVLDEPAGEKCLATVYNRPGPHTEAARAREAGRALAGHLGVPFYFASPDAPDDNAPRWRDSYNGSVRVHPLDSSSHST